jgi:Peptide methionine sulfoxide reductase
MIPPPRIVREMIGVLVSILIECYPRVSYIPRTEYRSGIYTHSEEQMKIAKEVTEQVQKEHFTPKDQKIVTEIQPAGTWYNAEVSTLCCRSRLTDADMGSPQEYR